MTATKEHKLAIIIPAFKSAFLNATLQSISIQTNKNFHLYIGDDASPEDLYTLIEPFESQIPLTYYKFENNLGSISLTRQWERCIDLTFGEPYIWLFSDDDVMPADSVQLFYDCIEKTKGNFPVYRFNLQAINANSEPLFTFREKKELENNKEFALQRFQGKSLSAACEYIFRRDIYEKYNAFVDFPKGWYSDDATWIKFSQHSAIYTIPGKPILWRISDFNISSQQKNKKDFYTGFILYLAWLLNFFNPSKTDFGFNKPLVFYCYKQCIYYNNRQLLRVIIDLFHIYNKQFGIIYCQYYLLLFISIYIKYSVTKFFKKIFKLINE